MPRPVVRIAVRRRIEDPVAKTERCAQLVVVVIDGRAGIQVAPKADVPRPLFVPLVVARVDVGFDVTRLVLPSTRARSRRSRPTRRRKTRCGARSRCRAARTRRRSARGRASSRQSRASRSRSSSGTACCATANGAAVHAASASKNRTKFPVPTARRCSPACSDSRRGTEARPMWPRAQPADIDAAPACSTVARDGPARSRHAFAP